MISPRMRELMAELDERLRREGLREDGLRLPFNGTLSDDEQRMLDQFAFEDYAA